MKDKTNGMTPQNACGEILKLCDGLEAQGYEANDILIMLTKLTATYADYVTGQTERSDMPYLGY